MSTIKIFKSPADAAVRQLRCRKVGVGEAMPIKSEGLGGDEPAAAFDHEFNGLRLSLVNARRALCNAKNDR